MASRPALRPSPASDQAAGPARRVALVTRVSTLRQAENDEGSLTTQRQRLRAHVAYKQACGENWVEVALYQLPPISGKVSLRSEPLQRLQQDIVAGRVNTVCCTALSRVSRNVVDFLQFMDFLNAYGAQFVSLKEQVDTTSSHGKLLLTVLAALSQFEREQTAERTRDAVNARAERGLFSGGQLYGYDTDPNHKGQLLVNEREAAGVRFGFETYLERGSLAGTVAALNAAGYRTKAYTSRNKVVHAAELFYISRVQTMLQNPAYIGMKELGKNERLRTGGVHAEKRLVQAVWPGIVDKETFEAVQALMRANGQRRTNQAKAVQHAYVLNSGLLWCGACGSPMEGRSGTGRLGARYYYYVCTTKTCGLRVVAPEIEGAILDRLGVLANDPNLLDQLVAATNIRLQRQLPVLGKRRRAITREFADVKGQVEKALANFSALSGSRGQQLLRDQLDTLAERKEQIEASLRDTDRAISQLQAGRLDTQTVQQALAQVGQIYACLQPLEQKELFRLLVNRAEVHPRRIVLELHSETLSAVAEGPTEAYGAKTLWVTNSAPRRGFEPRT